MENQEIVDLIEEAIAELGPRAQPHEIAALRELALDAKEAESAEQLTGIVTQLHQIRAFCARRSVSEQNFQAIRDAYIHHKAK